MDVLIVGLRGLGVEIAKNLCLAGPRSVTLFDPEPTTPIDVGANYYLTMAQLGVPRAVACVDRLAELNPYVTTTALKGEPDVPCDCLARACSTPRIPTDRAGAD